VRYRVGVRDCLLVHSSLPVSGRSQSLPPPPELKQPGREAHHSPPSLVKAKNTWSYASTLPYVFIAWCLIMHRDTNSPFLRNLVYGSKSCGLKTKAKDESDPLRCNSREEFLNVHFRLQYPKFQYSGRKIQWPTS
jgi:hypothetical protein